MNPLVVAPGWLIVLAVVLVVILIALLGLLVVMVARMSGGGAVRVEEQPEPHEASSTPSTSDTTEEAFPRERLHDLAEREERAQRRERAADEREQALVEREHAAADRERTLAEHARHLESVGEEEHQRADALDRREREVATAEDAVAEGRRRLAADHAALAELTPEQAREEVLARADRDARREALLLTRDITRAATRDAEATARRTLVTTIQRLASEQTAESTLSTVDLPSEEMKGRIIGREGRNVRTFEQVTGTNLMVDDTPGMVVVSCFDPARREAARMTLEELVADGRIHPARIEEVHQRSLKRLEEQCRRAAEDALIRVGVSDLDPELVRVLGTLRYRTSFGQNVLQHLVECGLLAGMIAAEVGADPALARRAAFLHDIGKALTTEGEGSHALIGAQLARSHGESEEVAHAIAAHHGEVEATTVLDALVQIADQISGSRPGARREALETYVERLSRLEGIALAHDGVDHAFAMQAGHELRIVVQPESIDDLEAQALAREIAREVESELTYPGQIKVTVVRETRATDIAH